VRKRIVSVPQLIAQCADPDSRVRVRTLRRLATRQRERERIFVFLVYMLADPAYQVRKVAVQALGTREDAKAIPHLAGMLNDRVADVRLYAVEALAKLGGPQVVACLLPTLNDRAIRVRIAALHTLLHMGIVNSTVVSALLHAAARTRSGAQASAFRAALQLGDSPTLCCLLLALHDQPEQMPTDSFATETGLPAVLAARSREAVYNLIIDRLGRLGDTCAFEPVSALLWRKDGSVRSNVVSALKQLDDARALPLLRTVLADRTDKNFMIRWLAVDALVFLAEHHPLESRELHVASWLRNCLSDTYEPVRRAASKALQQWGSLFDNSEGRE
jgi:hypothetical protein